MTSKLPSLEYWCSGCEKNLSLPPVKIPVGASKSELGQPYISVEYHFFCYRCAWAMFHRFLGWRRRKKFGLGYFMEMK